jgi:lipopolysaccharide transport system ATP-binding protein
MSAPVIKVEGLSKQYMVGTARRQHTTFYDLLTHFIQTPLDRLRKLGGETDEANRFWALRDINFDVQSGDVLGIIGRNGAGKSTLLKILSRITDPTNGRITIRGRVASLLEVGTGFHPELTGRENVFLNGAILGMKRREIEARFDEIMAFAEVERFVDTPVKRYSSGMYVRLAFAVAAHLDPQILIVDEVLAVGDTEFQKKCLGKMRAVSEHLGRTVLFVSHNLPAVHTLCTKVAYLDNGYLVEFGDTGPLIARYTHEQMEKSRHQPGQARQIAGDLSLESFSFFPDMITSGDGIDFSLEISSAREEKVSDLAILIYSMAGTRVAILDLRRADGRYLIGPGNSLRLSGKVKRLDLVEGDYLVGLYLKTGNFQGDQYDLSSISIMKANHPTGIVPYAAHNRGLLELNYDFDRT